MAEPRGRLIVLGAGAVGASLGGLLARAGRDVALVARGAHRQALSSGGLRLRLPGELHTLRLPVHGSMEELGWQPGDTVLLAVKSQDTEGALLAVDRRARLVCAQNGVSNEPRARGFTHVYGMMVWTPALCLEPGCVDVFATPPGVLRIGCFPAGEDAFCRSLAADLASAGYDAEAVPDVMHCKRSKLLCNLGNALDAFCLAGPDAREFAERVRAEGARVLRTARLSYEPDFLRAMNSLLSYRLVEGQERGGGSTWQSLVRGRPLEVAYLNGTICQLGAQHSIATPWNSALCALAARSPTPAPRSVPVATLFPDLGDSARQEDGGIG